MEELTLSIIKPEIIKKKVTGRIISMFEDNGFDIIFQKKVAMTEELASEFYAEHKEAFFFKSLVKYMTSGHCIFMVLSKESAIMENRKIMGATDPKKADINTIRRIYGSNIEANAIHGSDSKESAEREIKFFLEKINILS